jgi:hypothetical protein
MSQPPSPNSTPSRRRSPASSAPTRHALHPRTGGCSGWPAAPSEGTAFGSSAEPATLTVQRGCFSDRRDGSASVGSIGSSWPATIMSSPVSPTRPSCTLSRSPATWSVDGCEPSRAASPCLPVRGKVGGRSVRRSLATLLGQVGCQRREGDEETLRSPVVDRQHESGDGLDPQLDENADSHLGGEHVRTRHATPTPGWPWASGACSDSGPKVRPWCRSIESATRQRAEAGRCCATCQDGRRRGGVFYTDVDTSRPRSSGDRATVS